jgi:Ca-activated chloride channel family protein
MTFARPAALIVALFGIVALLWLYRFASRRRAAQALVYSNLAFALDALRPSRWPGVLLLAAYAGGTAALLLALAGPHFFARVPTKDGTVVICIDTSGSMRARDVEPTRSEAALAAARAFIDSVPAGTRIGIVAFASVASVIQAPTADLDAIRDSLDRIPPPEGGTAIGDALALASVQLGLKGNRVIVLLTDGVNNLGRDPVQSAGEIAQRGIRIETVGVGSNDSGQIIPGTDQLADLDAGTLRTIAHLGHGRYAEARDAATLQDEFRNIALGTVWERKPVDGSFPFALAGGALLLTTFLIGMVTGRFP